MGNFFNYVIAFASAIGGFLFGYEIGIIDQVLDMRDFGLRYGIKEFVTTQPDNWDEAANGPFAENLANETSLVPVQDTPQAVDLKGNVTMTFLIGCAVGAIIVSLLADRLGRKRSILAGAALFTGGGLMQAFCDTLNVFYAGRIVSGLGIGLLSMCVPLYISETAPTSIRGRMIAVQQLMITIGILFAAVINTLIRKAENGNEREWRLSLSMQAIPGIILMVIMFFMPYSPRWLEDHDRYDESLKTLARIRAQSTQSAVIKAEYADIKRGVAAERMVGSATWGELLKPGIVNRLLIGVTLQCFQQWTGINVILYYASELFKNMGFDYTTASTVLNIVNAVVNVLGTLPGMYLVERLGRRKLLIWGGFGMGCSHYLVCLFIGLSKENPSMSWGAVIFVYTFILFYSSTWGPVVWVYQSEIFPLRIRAKGTGISTFFNWTMNAILAKITPIILHAIDFYFYLIFGSTGVLMALFTIAFVPETMGKSLEEMDQLFGSVSTQETVSIPPGKNSREKV